MVSFIGGGNRRKPPTCHKSQTNFMTMLYRAHLSCAGFELTTLVVIGTDCIGSMFKIQLPYDHDHNGPVIILDFRSTQQKQICNSF